MDFTNKRKIKYNTLEVIILSAGYRQSIKSFEPISTLNVGQKTLLENQIQRIKTRFNKCHVTVVAGYKFNSVYKMHAGQAKFIENTRYKESNNAESLRLAINNSNMNNILFIHGDLIFNDDFLFALKDKYFLKSFVVYDDNNFESKEVGVNHTDCVNIMSYSLPSKWSQMAYVTGKETELLRSVLLDDNFDKHLLSFEIINKIIDLGGNFKAYENKSFIKEIDSIKSIRSVGGA